MIKTYLLQADTQLMVNNTQIDEATRQTYARFILYLNQYEPEHVIMDADAEFEKFMEGSVMDQIQALQGQMNVATEKDDIMGMIKKMD